MTRGNQLLQGDIARGFIEENVSSIMPIMPLVFIHCVVRWSDYNILSSLIKITQCLCTNRFASNEFSEKEWRKKRVSWRKVRNGIKSYITVNNRYLWLHADSAQPRYISNYFVASPDETNFRNQFVMIWSYYYSIKRISLYCTCSNYFYYQYLHFIQ